MSKDFKIAKPVGACHTCQQPIPPGEEIVALARTSGEEIVREDYHPACWEQRDSQAVLSDSDVLGVWRTRIPKPEEKKKLLVDDSLLINFFERLDGTDETARIGFRYVLALILMRKRRLVYEGMERRDDGTEVWKMRFKGAEDFHEVIDPHMDEEKIAMVSASLGEIMEGDFE
jgi:hypothetical protein